ncbi:unnamed protein product [Caenorhabditis bovis]|uniref:Phosphatidylinositol 4-kinase type 2 n=1 Tax=Caenorhabditis bovis TaxID=2654633 RepID=A0A8S1EFT0_9PELO|nr:unnamed protein product [Caenorhabditis bovis]
MTSCTATINISPPTHNSPDANTMIENRKIIDDEFQQIFRRAQEAINKGVHPSLIPEGSSGSYFVYDVDGEILGVFKPKDEEPFASLNPKWPKFFQRMLCFCCFGRACLIPNTGYLSEAAASIVSEMMQLDVVPTTRIVKLASPSFYYSRFFGNPDVRPKEGSFQLYVKGYESGNTVFARWNYDKKLLSEEEEAKFRVLFQKMCIVDYVIRNTDRHMDNLLVKHVPGKEIQLAAIDNGLAFPVRHPECASSQLRVVRGQLWNLRQALLQNETPAEMARREPVVVNRRYRRGEPNTDDWDKWFRIKMPNYSSQQMC